MLRRLWNAIATPSLTRRLVVAQLALFAFVWIGLVIYIIHDIAYMDEWYPPKIMRQRGDIVLAVTESLADRPRELEESLRRIDEFQRAENREEDTRHLRMTMMVWIGEHLVYVTPGESRTVAVSKPFVIEHSVQDGVRYRTWMQPSTHSAARVAFLLPADGPNAFLALWSRGFVLLPIVIAMPLLLIPAWLSVWLGLRPFRKVSAEIASKGPDDLAPLAFQPKHRELLALGRSVDGLLERLRSGVARERRFIADAAHELRTPLAAIRINVEALRQRPHAPEDALLLEGLVHSGDRATRLVSQLLALMRSDASPEDARPVPLRLDELAQERLAMLGGIARERNVELELDAPAAVQIEGARQGLTTLIDNLIENAVKHSPAGGVVRVAVSPDAGGAVLLVEDAGPGIPVELRERVFERFFRAPDQSVPGSGLGLAIVRSVADTHGAVVTLEDGVGGIGLRVRVRFEQKGRPLP